MNLVSLKQVLVVALKPAFPARRQALTIRTGSEPACKDARTQAPGAEQPSVCEVPLLRRHQRGAQAAFRADVVDLGGALRRAQVQARPESVAVDADLRAREVGRLRGGAVDAPCLVARHY